MTFGDYYVEKVRLANPIRDVVAEHVMLDGNTGRCPFHPDTDPSLSVVPTRGTFKCFGAGCGASGDVFTFVQWVEGILFGEALEKLARRAGIARTPRHAELEPVLRERDIVEVTELVAKTYHHALTPETRAYITKTRGLPEAFIDQYTMGWADGRSGVTAVYRKYGDRGLDVMRAAGLARQDYQAMPGNLGVYDSFEDRLVVSTRHLGRIVFLSGRALRPDQTPKYYHQPGREAPLFDEDNVDPDMTLVTEGVFDALSLRAWGYPATACFGGVRVSSVQKLRRMKQVYAVFDGDRAGRVATMKLAMHLGATLRCIRLPDGLDPNDFYRQHAREAFERLCQQAMDPVQFALADLDRTRPLPQVLMDLGPTIDFLVTLSPATAEAYVSVIAADLTLSRTTQRLLREEVEDIRAHGRRACPSCGTGLHGR
jgi:DNA primase